MAQVIKPKRSYTAGDAPTTSDLVEGEIAINTADAKLYIRDNSNNIVAIAGGGGTASGATTEVTQSSHGLAVKDCIRHNGTNWVKAQANSAATLALGMVTAVADANTFTVAQSGRFELSSHGLTVGQWYYLSADTAGGLVTAEPSLSQPLVYVESANHVFVYPYRPTNVMISGQTPLGIFVDEFTGNGSTAAYTLSGDPLDEKNTQVFVNGVYQEKATYSISGTTLTFDDNIANGSSIEVVRYAATAFVIGVPDDNSVTSAKIVDGTIATADLADDAVTTAKIADDAITSALIADDAITSALIADDAITSALIADDAVVTAGIANDAVTGAKLNPPLVQGDIIYADGTDTITRLAKGTAAQVLTMNGGATAPSWADAAGGGLELQATPKTANFTAVAGERYLVDTSSSAFTMTFPASPSVGDTVGVVDYAGTFDTNNLTLGRNSVNVLREAADGVINTKNWSTNWMYVHATPGWLPVG